jgi:hypothetical protein
MAHSMDLRLISRFMTPSRDLISAVPFNSISNYQSDLTLSTRLINTMRELQKLIHQRVEKLMVLDMLTVKSKETKKAKRALSEVNIILKMSLMRRTSHG